MTHIKSFINKKNKMTKQLTLMLLISLSPHLCCFYHNISGIVPSSVLQVSVNPGNYSENFKQNPLFNLQDD